MKHGRQLEQLRKLLLRRLSIRHFDRVLATEFGVRAMEFVMEGRYGQMVAYHHPDVVGIPLEEAVREQNLVAPDSRLVHTAKGVGIEFGD